MMKVDIFYSTAAGRALFFILERSKAFGAAARFLRTGASKCLIRGFIKRNNIDMTPYKGQSYASFADFFGRKKENVKYDPAPGTLISPCDGLLSVYEATPDMYVPMKGSVYGLTDLIPNGETAGLFAGGLCFVFRLEASDCHRFCCFDDGILAETHFVGGRLHSVQPAAHGRVPVLRLNRRWWSLLETEHFGTAVQIEVGAMLVGGVSFGVKDKRLERGADMGCFELAGSTVVLFVTSSVKERLGLLGRFASARDGQREVRVSMGEAIGTLTKEPKCGA